jgi:hypothetical protein
MPVGGSDVNGPALDSFSIYRLLCGQCPCRIEKTRQVAFICTDMQNDQDGGWQLRGQGARQSAERVDASGRSTNDNNVPIRHSIDIR